MAFRDEKVAQIAKLEAKNQHLQKLLSERGDEVVKLRRELTSKRPGFAFARNPMLLLFVLIALGGIAAVLASQASYEAADTGGRVTSVEPRDVETQAGFQPDELKDRQEPYEADGDYAPKQTPFSEVDVLTTHLRVGEGRFIAYGTFMGSTNAARFAPSTNVLTSAAEKIGPHLRQCFDRDFASKKIDARVVFGGSGSVQYADFDIVKNGYPNKTEPIESPAEVRGCILDAVKKMDIGFFNHSRGQYAHKFVWQFPDEPE